MPFRLANYVNAHDVDLVLLAGDLLDGHGAFRETGEQLAEASGQMEAQVCIAPATTTGWAAAACGRRWTGRKMSIFSGSPG